MAAGLLTVALVFTPASTNDGEMEHLKKMQLNSKGGKQNLWDDELSPLTDAQLEAEFLKARAAGDTQRLQKLVKEEKRRGQRNKKKRK